MVDIKSLVVLLVLCSVPVSAYLSCDFNDNPYIRLSEPIYWHCETDNDHCFSYVLFGGDLLQLNPERVAVFGVGVVDSFVVENNLVRPYFTFENLRDNKTVDFVVRCGSDVFNASVTPVYKEPYEVLDRAIWAKENMPYIAGFLLFVVLLVVGVSMLWRVVRSR